MPYVGIENVAYTDDRDYDDDDDEMDSNGVVRSYL